ncbi:hypothetical protein A3A79_05385 [Candidatus Gottesmanbacteria bacterium RIFCSPLOWO2_01_FULL_43_11b]|uniref:OmpR/PhoB-type domain-containing protein n=1 Tax=Candidatus Gottesmanbacteria bacterium RIFCSPLOWO2_01_FULL_43_11b TaxID=1798392 RepID=A0A1F6AK04_9BACT|nr:MAG: hypothetical protein A3A79_05385 [Candidatus Gottesmanbacteria bacterium RIFCSPLOWO2_01_FULL_43_11b]
MNRIEINRERLGVETYLKLLDRKNKYVSYDILNHELLVNKNVIARLFPLDHSFFLKLLINPNSIQTYEVLLEALFFKNGDTLKNSNKFVKEAMISAFRQCASRVRSNLRFADTSLPAIVQTIRETGYIYIAHPSIQRTSK